MIPREKTQKLKEIAPGEVRVVCLICETPIKGRALYCERHKGKQKNACAKCGKGMRGTICATCRQGKINVPKLRGTKRVLTEADRPLVEKLWREGLTGREIATQLGLVSKSPTSIITRRRWASGWNLSYRQPNSIPNARKMNEEKRAA